MRSAYKVSFTDDKAYQGSTISDLLLVCRNVPKDYMPLYGGLGENVDGPITQKGVTDVVTALYTLGEGLQEEIGNKVDKVEGKGLSEENYTAEEKAKLAGLENYDDTDVKARLDEVEGEVAGHDVDIRAAEADIEDVQGRMTVAEQKIAAMATDMKYKGSVDDFAHLPTDAQKGDVYTTRDDGKEYVFDGEVWLEIGGGGVEDFDALTNRPKYNSAFMTHETNIPEVKTAVWDAKQDALTAGDGIIIDDDTITYDPEVLAPVEYVDGSITDTMLYIDQQDQSEHAGRVAGDDLINAKIGDLAYLQTAEKGSIVGAVNEVLGDLDTRVPEPTTGDADKFLKGNGTWAEVQAGPRTGQLPPDETTAGVLGDQYICVAVDNVAMYLLTAIDATDPNNKVYTWKRLALVSDDPVIDPEANELVVPDAAKIEDDTLDLTNVKGEIEDNTLTI